MKEKQPAKLSESCRSMQDSSKAELFRSRAANDESDGFARYSERKMAIGNLGGNAGKFSSHRGWGLIFLPFYFTNALANLGGTASKRLAPMGLAFIFLENRYKHRYAL